MAAQLDDTVTNVRVADGADGEFLDRAKTSVRARSEGNRDLVAGTSFTYPPIVT